MFPGFGSSPVTKGILISTVVASTALHLRDPRGDFDVTLDIWRVIREGELWRLFTSHAMCSRMGPLVASSLCFYRLRRMEPLLGSRKFGAFVAVTHVMALPFEAAAGVYFGTVKLTPGPIPIVFALLMLYYGAVPPLRPRLFGLLGMDFSDKALTYCIAGMLAFCDGWKSFVPAVCGALVGSLYLMDTMSVQSIRLPGFVYRNCWRVCKPLLRLSRRSSSLSRARFGATRSPPTATQGPWNGRGIMSSLVRPQPGPARSRFPSPPQPLPPPSEESISALTGMGFDRNSVLLALQHSGNNASAAANMLISGAFGRGGGGSGAASSGSGVAAGGGGAGTPAGSMFGGSTASPHDHEN